MSNKKRTFEDYLDTTAPAVPTKGMKLLNRGSSSLRRPSKGSSVPSTVLTPAKDVNQKGVKLAADSPLPKLTDQQLPLTPPAHERFKHLLNPSTLSKESSPVLPERYSRLLKIFGALETLISFHKVRSNGSHIIFDNIKAALENTANMAVNVNDLSSVIAVCENMFDINLSKIQSTSAKSENGGMVSTVRLDWTDNVENVAEVSSVLRARKQKYEEAIQTLAEQQHEEFLKSNNFQKPENGFHAKFVESGPMPICEKLKDLLTSDVEIKTREKIRETLKMYKRPSDVVKKETEKTDLSKLSVLERIKLKEQRRKELLEANKKLYSTKEMAFLGRLPKIASLMDGCFKSSCKTAMYVQQLTNLLIQAWKSPISVGEVIDACHKIADIVPEWIKIETNEFGSVVIVSDVERPVFMSKIQAFVDEKQKDQHL